jgi:hypothetical protein
MDKKENVSEYLLILQFFYFLASNGDPKSIKWINNMSGMNDTVPGVKSARDLALKNYYLKGIPGNDIDKIKQFINGKISKYQNSSDKNKKILSDKLSKALLFLNTNYDNTGKFKETISYNPQKNPDVVVKPDATGAPAPLVPAVKPAPSAKPSKPQYKTREEVIEELMSQGKITDPSQAVALSSPVTVNGRTFQALISPLGTLPGPGGVRVPIINDQQANTYAMSILKEYNKLAGVGYQPLNDISKGNLDPKNTEPLKKLLTRIDLAVNNKTSHEQTADGEPILPQMREPKLSADTENLYKILKRLSGQTLGSIAQPDKEKSSVNPAVDTSTGPIDSVKKNDVNTSPVSSQTSVTPGNAPLAAPNTTRKPQILGFDPKPELSNIPSKQRVPRFNAEIAKDDETLTNQTDPNLVIDSSKLYFKDENNNKIPGSDTPAGFFERLLDWFETSEYYSVSNKMSEADFIKRINDCKTPNDKNNVKKCWTVFPEFIMGKLSSILGTYRTPDNKIYKTLTKYIPLGVTLNIDMIINLIEANDPRYSNLSESFIGG